jgi:glutathione synthase/RimK-type ligase-like ATP-grasp enzyme
MTHLYQEGVATFYSHSEGPLVRKINPLLVFRRAGLPAPRWVHVTTRARGILRRYVERMGGFPVILKYPGLSRGVGVTRIDSLPSLFSIVDYTVSHGDYSVLCAYVHPATHWRAILVGNRIVSCYRNVVDEDDFRTSGSDQEEDYRAPVPMGLEEAAIGAVRALGHEFGGVDILEHTSGRLYVLESNHPCYFASEQLAIGTDVSGAMIEHLFQKSRRLICDVPHAPSESSKESKFLQGAEVPAEASETTRPHQRRGNPCTESQDECRCGPCDD